MSFVLAYKSQAAWGLRFCITEMFICKNFFNLSTLENRAPRGLGFMVFKLEFPGSRFHFTSILKRNILRNFSFEFFSIIFNLWNPTDYQISHKLLCTYEFLQAWICKGSCLFPAQWPQEAVLLPLCTACTLGEFDRDWMKICHLVDGRPVVFIVFVLSFQHALMELR